MTLHDSRRKAPGMSPESFREARLSLGLTVAEMAEELCLTPTAVYRYESGDRSVSPPVAKLVQMIRSHQPGKDSASRIVPLYGCSAADGTVTVKL